MSTDRYVRACPYCGGTEMIEAYQGGYGALSSRQKCFCRLQSEPHHLQALRQRGAKLRCRP